MTTPTESGGLFASLRRMGDVALGLIINRFELFTVELQEEKIRFFDLLLRVVAVIVLGFMTLIAGTALLVVWLWDTAPVLVLLVVTLGYAGTGGLLACSIQRRLKAGPKPFAGTLAEFRKDRECLGKHD
jgi:uncharacterized membrane protein YqjE